MKLADRHIFSGEGWLGFRLFSAPSRYFVVRNVVKHPPRYSERNGYRRFRVVLKFGSWQVGWFMR